MFFILSKILGFFALPSNLVISCGLLGALLLPTQRRGGGSVLVIGSLIVLAIIGLSPIGNALILPLEERFPPWESSRGAPDGVVVLGGAIGPELSTSRHEVSLNESAERMTAVAELARQYPRARIVFSGGNGGLLFRQGTEAEFALRLFLSFGIARERLVLEDQSRNTIENAIYAKDLAAPKPGERWLLVTSAHHMPRSVGVFRKKGFAVEAYPVDFRTRGRDDLFRPFASVGDGLRRTDTATREWAGLVIYWLTGQVSELFPGPIP
jgi:uncharacterized SAM-binding protein YcdF (DUF218 family)